MPKSSSEISQIGISAGRSIGAAVRRNRAKRLLREAVRNIIPKVHPGWDILLLSRHPLPDASFTEIQSALTQLLARAGLLNENHGI